MPTKNIIQNPAGMKGESTPPPRKKNVSQEEFSKILWEARNEIQELKKQGIPILRKVKKGS